MRLIFHWTLTATFEGEVRLHMKGKLIDDLLSVTTHASSGSRDPYNLSDDGAGFVLSWQNNVKILVGGKNDDAEFIQITSDSMCIAIPK